MVKRTLFIFFATIILSFAQDSTYIKKLEQDFNFYKKNMERLEEEKKAIDEKIRRNEGALVYIRIEFMNESKRLDSLKRK